MNYFLPSMGDEPRVLYLSARGEGAKAVRANTTSMPIRYFPAVSRRDVLTHTGMFEEYIQSGGLTRPRSQVHIRDFAISHPESNPSNLVRP